MSCSCRAAAGGSGLRSPRAAAQDGAKVALIAKTAEPHPKLPGTIYTAAEEIEAAGGEALPIVGDIRDENAVAAAVQQTVERFGGIDLVVNNASAINLSPMRELPVKRFDLMQQINARGTFVVTQACLPHLRESDHAHVLTLSPPLSVDRRWLAGHSAYTLSKMGMTMITLGVAADEAEAGIGANCLWPRTIIATAAVQNLLGGDEAMARARTPEIYADAALPGADPRPAHAATATPSSTTRCSPRPASPTCPATRRPVATWCSTSSSTAGRRAFPPDRRSAVGRHGRRQARPRVARRVRRPRGGRQHRRRRRGLWRARLARPGPGHLLARGRDRRARLRAARRHLARDGRADRGRPPGLVPARRPRPGDVPDPDGAAARRPAAHRGARRRRRGAGRGGAGAADGRRARGDARAPRRPVAAVPGVHDRRARRPAGRGRGARRARARPADRRRSRGARRGRSDRDRPLEPGDLDRADPGAARDARKPSPERRPRSWP